MSADSAATPTRDEPLIGVELASRAPTADPAQWDMAWTVQNLTVAPLRILGAWLPHGRFRSPRQPLDPPMVIAPGEQADMRFPVQCREEQGTVVENCFVILNVQWNDAEWQVFARITVTFGADGTPEPQTVLVTAQRAGFSA